MHRLTDALGGGVELLVKRDDCTGLALGGNKARKLEHLCAEALDQGCDVLVTGGGVQSNHVRMTSAAANRLGLECHVVLAVSRESTVADSGNVLLDGILGVHAHPLDGADYYELEAGIEELGAALTRAGRRPFVIPIGGASITGAAAYAAAADELQDQLGDTRVDWIVVADGSGGTHAGLLAGLGDTVRVLGVDVGTRPDLDDVVPRLASATARRTGRGEPPSRALVDHDHYGAGYGEICDSALEAITLTARSEGLVLDPVYTGKAMAGLFSAVRDGRIAAGERAVFWHTGGAPALFSTRYASAFPPPITPAR
jgi:D-cysteine desulfhydrase family pyridoxal phosphate-dependent enzyme